MIPRVRVNYGLGTMLRAVARALIGQDLRGKLRQSLSDMFGTALLSLTPSGRGGLYHLLASIDRPTVVVPAYTCKAVVEAATLAGKRVAFIDGAPGDFNMDPALLAGELSPECVVIATHQFGIPCDIERIVRIAHDAGALVIEDAAASFGTRVGGRLTGTFGDAAFFSFDSSKTINVPLKGGFVLIRDPDWFHRYDAQYQARVTLMPWLDSIKTYIAGLVYLVLKLPLVYRVFHYLNFSRRGRYTADSAELDLRLNGFHLHDMTHWQAGMAWEQVCDRDSLFAARRRYYAQYRALLAESRHFVNPPEDVAREWVCCRYPIRVRGDKLAFYAATAERGVDMAFSFTFIGAPDTFRQAHVLTAQVLDLPYYSGLPPSHLSKVAEVCLAVDSRMGS